MSTRMVYRPVWLSVLILGLLLLTASVLLVGTAYRSRDRLQPIHVHLDHLSRLQQAGMGVQELLTHSLGSTTPVDPHRLAMLRDQIDGLVALDGYMVADTPQRLTEVRDLLTRTGGDPQRTLAMVLDLLRQVLSAETQAHNDLLKAVDRDARAELDISTAIVIALPLLAAVLFFALRRRILLPLRNLGNLMTLLSQQHYRSFPIDNADPILLPLFANYNQMVSRLAELEKENRAQRRTLEHDVRTATEALLAQQRSLARAERLAAVGEIAAGLAHELRNPLAGVQMALGNLRSELSEPEHARRLDLMISELKRVVRLLNDALSQSRQPPEPPVDVDIDVAVTELAALTRYQIPPQVRIECAIAPGLNCRLPEGTLRQAVLNLILNAAQAIGENPGTIALQADRNGNTLSLSVCDDGPGFPPALLHNGARSFATWREDGTGLGLAMVRRFVHDLGGELHLSNREPRGACVTLTLPCKDHNG